MQNSVPILTLILGGIIGVLLLPAAGKREADEPDTTLQALRKLTGSEFKFSTVIEQTCGAKILSPSDEHRPLMDFIPEASAKVAALLSQEDSPARQKRRINEVSALFENALRLEIDAHPDFTCDFPKTKAGEIQRSGYPDLRVEHLPTGTVAYLDPKLFEDKSIKSSFRTFYYEPSTKNAKVTEDALHLLIGFPHDGKTREWTFAKPHLVDLSTLEVTLKAEFSASNKEIYKD